MLHNLSNLTLRSNTQYTVLVYPYNKLKFHLMYNIISYLIKSMCLQFIRNGLSHAPNPDATPPSLAVANFVRNI